MQPRLEGDHATASLREFPRSIGKRFSEASRIRDYGIKLVEEDKKQGNAYAIEIPVVAKDEKRKAVRFTPDSV